MYTKTVFSEWLGIAREQDEVLHSTRSTCLEYLALNWSLELKITLESLPFHHCQVTLLNKSWHLQSNIFWKQLESGKYVNLNDLLWGLYTAEKTQDLDSMKPAKCVSILETPLREPNLAVWIIYTTILARTEKQPTLRNYLFCLVQSQIKHHFTRYFHMYNIRTKIFVLYYDNNPILMLHRSRD